MLSITETGLMKPLRIFLVNVGHRRMMFPLVTPPMGIMSLAAYIRTKFDATFRLVNQRAENYPDQELVKEIVAFEPDIVGFSSLTVFGHLLEGLARDVRAACPKTLIALGGPHASAFEAAALEAVPDANVLVVGEGELAFERIIEAYQSGSGYGDIPGLVWRTPEGNVVTNPGDLPPIADLDTLPFPAYDLIDISLYWHQQSQTPLPPRKYASLVSSRGCPYKCMWCHKIFGKKFRGKSAERMAEEIAFFNKQYDLDEFEFIDDIFNFDHKRLHTFADLLRQRDLRIKTTYPNGIRGDILTPEDIEAFLAIGTYFCSFALESGSPRIQELTGKHLNIPRFLEGLTMMASKGVFTNGFMMLGFPDETEAEMRQTIKTAADSRLHTASFYTATPFPNTPLHAWAKVNRPEQLIHLDYRDADLSAMRVNLSAEPDEVLYKYQRKAHRDFYMRPSRVYRILRDSPQKGLVRRYLPIFLHRSFKGIFPEKH